MIPKKIHYCWFGRNPIPPKTKKYIDSWKKHCPDYEIVKWSEDNYDIEKHPYMKKAYTEKKWSFVSDYARLDIIYNEGGIYLDTDVELLKPLDFVLNEKAFFARENEEFITTGLGFGAERHNSVVKMLRDMYDDQQDFITCPYLVTKGLCEMGFELSDKFQSINKISVYSKEVFNPFDFKTGTVSITENTVSINHYAGSWMSMSKKMRIGISRLGRRIFGMSRYEKMKKFVGGGTAKEVVFPNIPTFQYVLGEVL